MTFVDRVGWGGRVVGVVRLVGSFSLAGPKVNSYQHLKFICYAKLSYFSHNKMSSVLPTFGSSIPFPFEKSTRTHGEKGWIVFSSLLVLSCLCTNG